MSAGAVKAGGVFVEIGADPRQFFNALNRVNKALGSMGRAVAGAGARATAIGVGTLAPFAAAVQQGAAYQSTLLNIQASTGATAAELDKLRAASMQMSQAMGVGPTQVTQSFLELLKAGMSVEQVLNGAGKAAIEFAAVGGMDVAQAAVVMSDAMNVFGVDAAKAANSISSAADASSTSIELLSQSFSMVSAVGALANQSIDDISAALAVLANAGVKGSDAGTSLKTMLLRLMAPAEDSVKALTSIGLSTNSFRDASGKMLPLIKIIETLNGKLGDMDQAAKDDIFRRIFGQDAIRAAAILTSTGVDGFHKMSDAMSGALPVGEKFKTLMSGLEGAGKQVLAALQRLAIVISDSVGSSLTDLVKPVLGLINGLAGFASKNKETVAAVAKFGVVAVALGGALTALGVSLQVTSFAFAGIGKAALFAISPLTLLTSVAADVGGLFLSAVPGVVRLGAATGSSMAVATVSVTRFAGAAAAQLASFAASSASGFASAAGVAGRYAASLAGVFASQFKIARFIGGTFAGSIVSAFSKTVMAVAPLRTSVLALGPAFGFISKGAIALGSDIARLAAPLAAPFIAAGSEVARFASGVAAQIGSYISSVASAVAATVTSTAKIAAAWVGNCLKSIYTFSAGVAAQIGAYIASIGAAVGATVASAARIAVSWVATAFPATVAFASGAVAAIATYIGSTVAAAAASVTNAVKSGAAWIASGLPGVLGFVGGAVAGIATYLGAAASAVAGSVASAAAVAAAWLAPLAPFALLAAAIGGAAALAYSFSGQIKGAFAGLGELVGQAGSAIGNTFNGVVSDASVVFSDLASTASTTFNGIYEAVSAGDLAGAMDVLWAGLLAGWLRGVEALMGYVDPWVTLFQNTFTYLGTEIAVVWEQMWTGLSSIANTLGAALMGAFDNIINGVLASWDTLEAGILKSWNYIQSFFKKGFDLKKENEKVDSKMAARARERELARPGVEGRTAKAAKENEQAAKESQARVDAMRAGADATAQGRFDENQRRADERRAATQGAEQRLRDLVGGQAETRARNQHAEDLGTNIANVKSVEGLRELAGEFHTLAAAGRLTTEQENKLSDALDAATERIMGEGATVDAAAKAGEGAAAAGAGGPSKAEVAGTFSAAALGGIGFGSSLDQKQLDALNQIARNTDPGNMATVAA